MAQSKLYNMVRCFVPTVGNGATVNFGSQIPSYLTPALAGVSDGDTVSYVLEGGFLNGDPTIREVGQGVISVSGGSLTRTTVYSSTSGGARIPLTGDGQMSLDALVQDFVGLAVPNSWSALQTFSAGLTLSGGALTLPANSVALAALGAGTANISISGNAATATNAAAAATAPWAGLTGVPTFGTMSLENSNAVSISGGAIDNTAIGQTTRAAGSFSTGSIGTSASTALLTVTSQTLTLPTPQSGTKAHIIGDAAGCFEQLDSFGTSTSIIFERANGVLGTISALAANDVIGGFQFKGYDGSAYSGAQALVRGIATGAWTGANHGMGLSFSTTALNSTAFATAMTLYSGLVVGPGTTDPGIGNLSCYSGLASVTSGGASPGGITDLALYQEIFPSVTLTSASRGLVDIPAANAIISQNAVAGFVRSKAGASGANGVALFGLGTAEANGTPVWGINTLLQDSSTRAVGALTGVKLVNEFDFNVMCPGTTVLGMSVGGNSLSQPAISQGFTVNSLGTGIKWQYGFTSQPGAATVGLGLGALAASGANVSSQPINLGWRDGSSASQTDVLQSASAFFVISSTSGSWNGVSIQAGSLFTSQGFGLTIGGQVAVSSDGSNNILVGNASVETILRGTAVIAKGAQADQSKSVQTPLTGFSITIGNAVSTLLLTPAGVLATGTIIMSAAPVDGQMVRISSSQTVTALTVSPSAGQTVNGGPTTITNTTPFAMIYDLATTTWYRIQ